MRYVLIPILFLCVFIVPSGVIFAETPKPVFLNEAFSSQEAMDRLSDEQRVELTRYLSTVGVENTSTVVPIESVAVSLDKQSYQLGETVNLGLFLDSSVLRSYMATNPDIRWVPRYTATVSVMARDGGTCIAPSDILFSATEITPVASLQSAADCEVGSVTVSLQDGQGRALGEWTIPGQAVLSSVIDVTPEESDSVGLSQIDLRFAIVLGGAIFLVAVAVILFWIIFQRSEKNSRFKFLSFPIFLSLVSLFGASSAEALSWRSGCSELSGGSYSDFTATLDKAIYRTGELITVSGSASAYNGTSGESSILNNDLYATLINPNGAVTTSLLNGFVFKGAFNTSRSGFRSYDVPSAPGSYSMYLMSWFQMTHVCNGRIFKNLPFVVVAAPVPTLTFSASPSSVTNGSTSTLSWNSSEATSCTASGNWSGSKAVSGSESTGSLTAGKTYTLTCTGSGGSVTRSVTVDVIPVVAPAPVLSFYPSPASVLSGSSSTLFWSSSNATSCTASGNWSGSKAVSGSESTGALITGKTYTLTCTGSGGSVVESVVVNLTPPVSTLRLCQDGIYYAKGGEAGLSIALNQGNTRSLTAYYDTGTDCSGASVAASASFVPSSSVISVSGSDPRTLLGADVPGASASGQQSAASILSVTHAGQTVTMPVTVIENCSSNCASEAASHCQGEEFTADDSCGVSRTCSGSRSCDMNWKEVVPGF